jgi:site-specific recombinase XerD
MIEDLRIRNYSPHTIEIYIRLVARFAKHFGCSPDRLGPEHVRQYQLLLLENKTSWSLFNQTVGALRFFYRVTLKRSWRLEQLPYGKRPKRLPCVLSEQEVLQLLRAAKGPRNRIALTTAYATGVRVSELVALRAEDIDSVRMLIHVRQGKGNEAAPFQRRARKLYTTGITTSVNSVDDVRPPITVIAIGARISVPSPAPIAPTSGRRSSQPFSG